MLAAPPPPAAWPAAEEVEGAESDADDVDQPRLDCIEASINAVHARYISCKPIHAKPEVIFFSGASLCVFFSHVGKGEDNEIYLIPI